MVRTVRVLTIMLAILGGAASAAMANSMNFYPGESIGTRSVGSIRFENGLGAGVRCSLSLSGSMTSGLLATTEGTTYGTISRAEATSCSGGTVRPLIEARSPWSLTYKAILGTWPNPTGLELYLSSVRLLIEEPFVGSCLYEARLGWLVVLERFATLEFLLKEMRFDEANETLSLVSGACFGRGSVLGTSVFSPEQIVELEALVRPGLLRLNPNPIVIPKEEGGNPNWRTRVVTVTNAARAGSENVTIPTNAASFPVGAGFEVPSTTCNNVTLTAGEANSCTVTVRYIGGEGVVEISTMSMAWRPVQALQIVSPISASTH